MLQTTSSLQVVVQMSDTQLIEDYICSVLQSGAFTTGYGIFSIETETETSPVCL